ncbi:MAG: Nramp family divalent metal transporter [Candidatus Methanomethylicaceae archaeon]
MGEETSLKPIPPAPPEAKGLGILKWIGPAVIISAMDVGGGEMIMASTVGAKYGPWLAWTILVGAFMIYWATQESARYSALTGETPLYGFYRVHPILAWIAFLSEIIWTLFFSVGIIANSGEAAYWLSGEILPWQFWAILLYLLIVIVLIAPKWIYWVLEKITTISAIIQIGGMIICAIVVTTLTGLVEFIMGMFSFGYLPPGADLALVLGLVGSGFGSGAGTALAAGYYVRERGIGIAGYIGKVRGLLGKEEEIPVKGFKPSTDHESISNWKNWLKIIRTNILGVLWPINLFGGLIFMYVATLVLRPKGLVPSGMKTVSVVAENFKVILGPAGWTLFMIVGLFNLWDTMLGCIDRDCRIEGNAIRFLVPGLEKKISERKAYMLILVLSFLCGSMFLFVEKPFFLFLLQAIFSAVVAPIIVFCFFMTRKLLPKEYRAHPIVYAFIIISIIYYCIMAVLGVASAFGIKLL